MLRCLGGLLRPTDASVGHCLTPQDKGVQIVIARSLRVATRSMRFTHLLPSETTNHELSSELLQFMDDISQFASRLTVLGRCQTTSDLIDKDNNSFGSLHTPLRSKSQNGDFAQNEMQGRSHHAEKCMKLRNGDAPQYPRPPHEHEMCTMLSSNCRKPYALLLLRLQLHHIIAGGRIQGLVQVISSFFPCMSI